MGSNKFCAVALVSTAMATSIQLGTLAIAPHFKSVRPGPYAFIFTFLVQYYSKFFVSYQVNAHFLLLTHITTKTLSTHSANVSPDVFFLHNARLRQIVVLFSRPFGLF